ncbi:MAG: site-2 protease family protein, partial [bacterium]|nr:site-2 protease family protein [bacterium]
GTRTLGMLSQAQLLTALTERGPQCPVAQAMEAGVEPVEAHSPLEPLLARLQGTPSEALPVMHDGRLVGLITLDNASEYLGFQAALEKRKQ